MILNISGKEYKVKFGFNDFADSDLLDKVQSISNIMSGAETDADVRGFGKLKDLFCVVRELLYLGFKRENPVESIQAVGDLLDKYMDEKPVDENGEEVEKRGILTLFIQLSDELANEGFLADFVEMLAETTESEENKITKIPQDHKKSTKKK